MTPDAHAHAGSVLDLVDQFDPAPPTGPAADPLDLYEADLATPDEWKGAFQSPKQLAEEAEAEKLSAEQAAVWLSEARDDRRSKGLRHGGKSLSYAFFQRWGYAIHPGNPGRVRLLADRGDLLRIDAGLRKTDEQILHESLTELELASSYIRKGAALAESQEKPISLIEAGKTLTATAMEKARLYGVIRQTQRIDAKINSTHTEVTEIGPNLAAALEAADERSAEILTLPASRPAALPAGDHLDDDPLAVLDAEWEEA